MQTGDPMECIPITLGNEAKLYICDRLQSGRSLSRYLLRHDIMGGDVITYFSRDVDPGAIQRLTMEEFNFGDRSSGDVPQQCLVEVLKKYLGSGKHRICVFENANAEPNYPYLSRMKSHLVTYGNEVYHVVDNDDDEEILLTIQESGASWLQIGMAGTWWHPGDNGSNVDAWTESDIEAISEGVEYIIIDAFDGEGYLIWSRAGHTPLS